MNQMIEDARQAEVNKILDGEHCGTVEFQAYLQSLGYGTLDDVWDEDGDGIYFCYRDTFQYDGAPLVRVVAPQGMDPRVVARILRKMAGVLEGTSGNTVMNLGLLVDERDYGRRLGEGVAEFSNHRRDFEDHQRQQDEGG